MERAERDLRIHAWTWRRAFLAGFAVWFTLGFTWVVASPLFGVPDESAHMIRAVAIVRGQLIGERVDLSQPGPPAVTAVLQTVQVPAGYDGLTSRHNCFVVDHTTADCVTPLVRQPGVVTASTTAGSYPPLFYVAVGLPSLLLSPAESVYAGRLISLLASSILLAAATAFALTRGSRWTVAGLALSVTPAVPFLAGSINPNGVEIAGAVLLWVSLHALLTQPTRLAAGWTVAAAAVVSLARPLSPAIVVGITVSVIVLTADRRRGVTSLLADRRIRRTVMAIAALVVVGGVWVVGADALDSFIGYPNPALTPGVAASESFGETDYRAEQLVGVFGWLDTPLPDVIWQLWLILAGLLLALALAVGSWSQRLVIAGLIAATVLVPVLAEAFSAAEMGLIWQGRYTLPVAVGTTLMAGITLADRRQRLPGVLAARPLPVLLVLAAAGGHVAAHLVTMTRYSLGFDQPLLAYLSGPGWRGPIPDVPLLVLLLASVSGLVLLAHLAGPGLDPEIDRPDDDGPGADSGSSDQVSRRPEVGPSAASADAAR